MPKKWVTLALLSGRIAGRMRTVEDALNEFVKNKKIDTWRFAGALEGTRYEVLTDRDVTDIESEILNDIRKRIYAKHR
ncbi:MAG: hypothetical protein ACE5Z5_08365 [Candidatus Bathyarchaeia archaeon]